MSANVLAFDFIANVDASDSSGDVFSAFHSLADKFGVTDVTSGRLTPNPARHDRGELWATRSPSGWAKFWVKNLYRIDPYTDHARKVQQPFRWSAMKDQLEGGEPRVYREAEQFGLTDGITTSFRLEGGAVAGLMLGMPKYDLAPGDAAMLLLASVYCVNKLAQFHRHLPLATAPLSERERECLCWVAAGKTDWEISEILGISHQTVHKHISNALKRLGSATRAQAVAVALMRRELSL